MQRTKYQRSNDYELVSLNLILDSGDIISLMDVYNEFSIFQDIFGTPMSCELMVSDGLDLFNTLPIKNNERLDLEFYTPGCRTVSMKMNLYSREDVILKESGSTTYYKFKFVSPEVLSNAKIKTSRSYTGTLSDIAGAIWSQNFPESSPLNTAQSESEYTLVLPFASPFSHLNFLSKKAKTSNNQCNFMFFEDFTGFSFVSLSDLFVQELRPDSYYSFELDTGDQTTGNDLFSSRFRIQDLTFVGKENVLDEISNGVYSGFVTQYDAKTKSINTVKHSYEDTFNKVVNLNEYELNSKTEVSSLSSPTFSNYHLYSGIFPSDGIITRMSQLNSLLNRRIKFLVSGNSSLNVGDKVKMNFNKQKFSSNVGVNNTDKYRSGMYIVTSVKHTISKFDGYTMVIEACTDSSAIQIPDQSRFESKQQQQGELL